MYRSRPVFVFAVSAALLALSGCGGMAHRHQGGEMHAAGPMGGMGGMGGMQGMHEGIMNARTPEERQALMAQHMKDMPGQCAEMMGPGSSTPAK